MLSCIVAELADPERAGKLSDATIVHFLSAPACSSLGRHPQVWQLADHRPLLLKTILPNIAVHRVAASTVPADAGRCPICMLHLVAEHETMVMKCGQCAMWMHLECFMKHAKQDTVCVCPVCKLDWGLTATKPSVNAA